MNISDRAVEAAVAAYLGSSYPHMYDEGEILEIRDDVRKELEAAAPFIAAHRIITTIEELRDLPEWSIIRTEPHRIVAEKSDIGWGITGNGGVWTDEDIARDLPVVVLDEPHEEAGK